MPWNLFAVPYYDIEDAQLKAPEVAKSNTKQCTAPAPCSAPRLVAIPARHRLPGAHMARWHCRGPHMGAGVHYGASDYAIGSTRVSPQYREPRVPQARGAKRQLNVVKRPPHVVHVPRSDR